MDSFFQKIKVRFIVLIYITSMIISTILFLKIPALRHVVSENSTVGDIIISTFVIIGLIIVSFKNQKVLLNECIGCVKAIEWKKIVKLYLLSISFVIALTFLLLPLITTNAWKYSSKYVLSSFVYFAVLAPIIEEFIFRGVLLNRFRMKYNLKSVVIISSILFAILHFDPNVFSRFLLGLLASLLYLETKNIINCMILHSLNNLTTLVLFLIISKCNFSNSIVLKNNKLFIVIGIIFIVISLIANISYIRRKWASANNLAQ